MIIANFWKVVIPLRYISTVGHLCVLVSLLWRSQLSVELCLPEPMHCQYKTIYQNRMIAGYAAGVALAVIELLSFISGLTMFVPLPSIISIGCHAAGSTTLMYFIMDRLFCDFYWIIFAFNSVLPFLTELVSALIASRESQRQTGVWSSYLILGGVATTLGSSLPVGYCIGCVNTPAEIIKQFCNESFISRYNVHLTDQSLSMFWSSVVSIFIVGGCVGSVLGATLANNLGRFVYVITSLFGTDVVEGPTRGKKATISTSFLSLAGALLFVLCEPANSVEMLILGRFVVGLAGGLTTSIVPMYLAELAPFNLVGAMGVACPMGVNVGVLVSQVMGLKFILGGAEDWTYLLSAYALLVIVCLPLLFILPESPKYLFVLRRNEETAIKELLKLRGGCPSLLTEELDMLREECRGADSIALGDQQWTMMRVLCDERLRLPLLLVCSMQAGQQTSGINAVFYYSQKIFTSSGLSEESSQYATIGCGFINVCTALVMLWLLPRAARRPLLLGSVLAAVVTLATLAVAMTYMGVAGMTYVCMAAVFAYVLAYGFGLGPIPYFIATEIFEVGPRSAGMAWGSLANWGGNFLVGMLFPLMQVSIGPYCFFVFAGITAALLFFQRIYFPETRGKTPVEVAQLCSRGFRSRPTRLIPVDSRYV